MDTAPPRPSSPLGTLRIMPAPAANRMGPMTAEHWSLVISIIALAGSAIAGGFTLHQRRRQAAAAVTSDLYPILRGLRDSAWQWSKPLGGHGNDHLVAMHYGLVDLADLTPAVTDRALREACTELLDHPAAGMALSIDPPRFMGLTPVPPVDDLFVDFGKQAHAAVEKCQLLRRGTT